MDTTHRCPSCKMTASWAGNAFRPFCSERCKLVDLGSWFDEAYRIPDVDDAKEFGVLEGLSPEEQT